MANRNMRENRGDSFHWILERNFVHGFTCKGFLFLILLFIVVAIVRAIFY